MGSSSLQLNPSWPHFLGLAAVAASILSGLSRFAFSDWSDSQHCQALLNRGTWLDPAHTNWQPEGCMLANYKSDDACSCLGSRPVVFVGDSVTRTLFFQLSHIIDPALPASPNDSSKHSDHTFHSKCGNDLSFFWDPYLNTSMYGILQQPQTMSPHQKCPALLVMGSGLWYLRYSKESGGLRAWEANIEKILATISDSSTQPADEIIMLPVEQVVTSKLSPERSVSMAPSDIDAMNSDLYHRLHNPSWNGRGRAVTGRPRVSLPMVFNQMLDSSRTKDGIHFSGVPVKLQASILLNFRCNNLAPKYFPLDKTCCNSYPSPSLAQFLTICATVTIGPAAWFLIRSGRRLSWLSSDMQLPLLAFSAGVTLIYAADRSNLWLKEHKQFSPWTFGFLGLLSLGVGLLTTKRADKDLGFLNRDQTDEWKGWMQIAILIYHYTGASKISGIYNPIRVLVASYLFMTGYGHTTFYIKKADFGFLRIAQVLVRLNLLTLVLAYVMNTDYISYYFSPLVSLWFLIIYTTMRIASQVNSSVPLLLGKIAISAAVVTALMKQLWLLQEVFTVLEWLFAIHWSAREWQFRVALDLWIVYVGMLAAIAVIKIREHRLSEHPQWPLVYKSSVVLSCTVVIWFFAFELLQESKFTYNGWHPYISFLPVLSFAILRNASVVMRSAHSRLFAFVGKCSLETFIIQYHLWLAGDTKGILLVLPSTKWRPLNFVLTTIMFIYVSDQLAQATTKLTTWICSEPSTNIPLPATASSDTIIMHQVPSEIHDTFVTPDIPSRTPRWLDRLAEGSSPAPRTHGFKRWKSDEISFQWNTTLRFFFGLGLMWALNRLW